MSFGQRLKDLKPNWQRSDLPERVRKLLQMRIGVRWMVFVIVLLCLALSACASTPRQCPAPASPPPELMVPPPPPGATQDRLDQILKQGRTSAPTSTP